MRSSTTPVLGEDVLEINCAVEAKTAVGEDVNPVALVVARSVDDGDLRYILARIKV
jgi:hypothetical protein